MNGKTGGRDLAGVDSTAVCCSEEEPQEPTALPVESEGGPHGPVLDEMQIRGVFAPGGPLAERLDGFETRESQVEMAVSVARALDEERVLLAEAGTGTGKSLAYLVPAILWSVRTSEKVVVSTHTINLQEQLLHKDLPALQGIEGVRFRAVVAKGRGNYLCRRKLSDLRSDTESLFEESEGAALQTIFDWSEMTREGSRSDLGGRVPEETWEKVACEADACGRARCPSYEECFFYRARREAARADVIVANHALLFSDLAVRAASSEGEASVLPPYSRLVLDEAHHVEDVATEHFSVAVGRAGISRLLGRLESHRRRGKGIVPHLVATLARARPGPGGRAGPRAAGRGAKRKRGADAGGGLVRRLEEEVLESKRALAARVEEAFDSVAEALSMTGARERTEAGESAPQIAIRLTEAVESSLPWREVVSPRLGGVAAELGDFAATLRSIADEIEAGAGGALEDLASSLTDLRGIALGLQGMAATLSKILDAGEPDDVRWIELRRRRREWGVRLFRAPLRVAESLAESLFARFPTVVLTSATLAVAGSFDFLKGRLGLARLPAGRLVEEIHPSPFDFDRQMLAALPPRLPDPSSPAFAGAVAEAVLAAVERSRGKALILFTAYRLLDDVCGRTRAPIEALGIRVLKQREGERDELARVFRTDVHSVLFATDSFWEGVDIKGEALELVVIVRLPFRVPSEPILEARIERMKESGEDPFTEYQVPTAAMKLRQGAGRLIRSKTDRGVLMILDPRISTRSYGRIFLESLPTKRLLGPSAGRGFWDEIARFFERAPEA